MRYASGLELFSQLSDIDIIDRPLAYYAGFIRHSLKEAKINFTPLIQKFFQSMHSDHLADKHCMRRQLQGMDNLTLKVDGALGNEWRRDYLSGKRCQPLYLPLVLFLPSGDANVVCQWFDVTRGNIN